MGEIADGLIDGTFDAETGEYLGEGPGYPRIARGTEIVAQHNNSNKSNPLNGVNKKLSSRGYITKSEKRNLMVEFTNAKSSQSNKELAEIIQSRWAEFIKFIKTKQ